MSNKNESNDKVVSPQLGFGKTTIKENAFDNKQDNDDDCDDYGGSDCGCDGDDFRGCGDCDCGCGGCVNDCGRAYRDSSLAPRVYSERVNSYVTEWEWAESPAPSASCESPSRRDAPSPKSGLRDASSSLRQCKPTGRYRR